jgi:cell division protein FtsQ
MRRVKPARDLHSARFLLARRRIMRYLPRRPMRLFGFGVLGIMVGVGGLAAVDFLDQGSRLARSAVAASAAFGFLVRDVEVSGRRATSADEVLTALDASRGAPILSISPTAARQRLQALPWVRTATVERHLPDAIVVHLTERRPMAFWQHEGKIDLVDTEGTVIATQDLGSYNDLLLVVGDGAPAQTQALIDILATEPELQKQVSAAVWVGDRRWNLKLNGGITIELPETNVAEAWSRLAGIERGHSLLARDIEKVDLRLGDRVTVTPVAAQKAPPPPPAKGKSPAKPI